ncbi:MAG: hypothetical protein Q8K28_02545 [Hoeflea sp.]|uniref:hypothetical protein n=1 Tax=Hoeflea sp. TaxID=1940281 RepID=UPI00273033C7|nr:hypothetical protein [Hoeflea sp.]MDP2118762.1 hypothetical protein [Hoeflea sp.]
MAIRTTIFRGLVVDLVIEEFNDCNAAGQLNAYVATLYTQDRKTSSRTLIRRSRLPGAGTEIEREIRRGGLQAFRRLTRM